MKPQRPPERHPAHSEPAAPLPRGYGRAAEVMKAVLGIVLGRGRTVAAALVLAIAATLMIGAWRAGPAQRRAVGQLRSLSAVAPGHVEALWWRLDFDPRPLGEDGTNWLALTAPELCVRLRFAPGAAGAIEPAAANTESVPAVFCRRWPELRAITMLFEPELAPDLTASYAGIGGSGGGSAPPKIDVRLSPRAAGWLAARPPAVFWIHPEIAFNVVPKLRSELQLLSFVLEDEERRLALAAAAAAPAAEASTYRMFDIAYDPADPRRALPAALRAERLAREPVERIFPIATLAFSLIPWCLGWLALLWGQRKWIAVVAALATAAALPWWGERTARALGNLWRPAGGFVDFFSQTLVAGAPLPILRDPNYSGEPGDRARPWVAGERWGQAPISWEICACPHFRWAGSYCCAPPRRKLKSAGVPTAVFAMLPWQRRQLESVWM